MKIWQILLVLICSILTSASIVFAIDLGVGNPAEHIADYLEYLL